MGSRYDIAACLKAQLGQPLIIEVMGELHARLPQNLKYHVAAHTEDVLAEVVLFACTDNRSEHEIDLLGLAAAFHDFGFIQSASNNEIIGANEAKLKMAQAGFSLIDQEQVHTMILDTQLRVSGGGPKQVASNELSGYLLDADVSNLGRDDFFEKAELVRAETQTKNRRQFYSALLSFMNYHEWYTPAAKALRGSKKQENLIKLREFMIQL